ncbi:ABC transporter ATP-binding protein [Zafaria cholistanensis]|uniref:ABC transporter ATP-binding protein n=1 Tax=Zafaria cholistanensis TaxID=1682741 RepID=A0A5A7NM99_9MICC|nr:ABC transporter ATP-binding protein [Zafaria cholistanensis]GER22035.1 ABC transporter ATP-binding protein [Zafaria cholistanensis]
MPAAEPSLVVDRLRKDFGPVAALNGRMVRVLDGISLSASPGRVTTLLGSNGAGKSTTLACAQGLLKADGGTVRLLGEDPASAGSRLRSRVGVMLQDGGLPPSAKPMELLRHVAGMYRNPADIAALAERLGISDFSHTTIRRLSGGQRQRVALAAALAGNPEVVFLDEPSAGLDPQSRQTVFDLIVELRDRGLCIVLTTHLMEDAQRLSDYVYIIDRGVNVAEGTVSELTARTSSDADARTLEFSARPGLQPPLWTDGRSVVEVSAGRYLAHGLRTPADLADLAGWWQQLGVFPDAVSMQPRTLEDVFLEIAEGGTRA